MHYAEKRETESSLERNLVVRTRDTVTRTMTRTCGTVGSESRSMSSHVQYRRAIACTVCMWLSRHCACARSRFSLMYLYRACKRYLHSASLRSTPSPSPNPTLSHMVVTDVTAHAHRRPVHPRSAVIFRGVAASERKREKTKSIENGCHTYSVHLRRVPSIAPSALARVVMVPPRPVRERVGVPSSSCSKLSRCPCMGRLSPSYV